MTFSSSELKKPLVVAPSELEYISLLAQSGCLVLIPWPEELPKNGVIKATIKSGSK